MAVSVLLSAGAAPALAQSTAVPAPPVSAPVVQAEAPASGNAGPAGEAGTGQPSAAPPAAVSSAAPPAAVSSGASAPAAPPSGPDTPATGAATPAPPAGAAASAAPQSPEDPARDLTVAVRFVGGEAEYRAQLHPGQVVSYVVSAAAGDHLHADLISENSDVLLEMHRGDTILFRADQGSVLMRELAEAGDYIVTLRGATAEVDSAFRLYLSLEPAAGTAPPAPDLVAGAATGVSGADASSGGEAAAEAFPEPAVVPVVSPPAIVFAGDSLLVPVLPPPDAAPSGGVLGEAEASDVAGASGGPAVSGTGEAAVRDEPASGEAPAPGADTGAAPAPAVTPAVAVTEAPQDSAAAGPAPGSVAVAETSAAGAEAPATAETPATGDAAQGQPPVAAAVPGAVVADDAAAVSDAVAAGETEPVPGAVAGAAAAVSGAASADGPDTGDAAASAPAPAEGSELAAAPVPASEGPAEGSAPAPVADPGLVYYRAANLQGAMLNLRRGPSRSEPVVSQAGEGRLLSGSLCQPGDGLTWCRLTAVDDPSIWGWAAAQFLEKTSAPQPAEAGQ